MINYELTLNRES